MKFFQSPEAEEHQLSIEETPHGYALHRSVDTLPAHYEKLSDTDIYRTLWQSAPAPPTSPLHASLSELLYRRLSERYGRRSARDIAHGGVEVGLEEEQRQATIMALAHLAVERPGWKAMLSEIALKMDTRNERGEPELFTSFFTMQQETLRHLAGERHFE